MSIAHLLSAALTDRTEISNIKLAENIAKEKNIAAVKELVELLQNKKLQNSCIKTLYETGEREPKLLHPYFDVFIKLLQSKNNRLQWGAMTALDSLKEGNEKKLFNNLGLIIDVADNGTVITRDRMMRILTHLFSVLTKKEDLFALINEQLLKAPENQFPTYAEAVAPFVSINLKEQFISTLVIRLKEIESSTKKIRVEKIIKKLSKN